MQRMVKLSEYLTRIADKNHKINAIIAQYDKQQLMKEADANKSNLVFLVKDNMCTKELPTSCCSEILRDYVSPFDATVVEHIREGKGIVIGKTNMDEFAMGTDNIYTFHGPVQNPLFPGENRSPGGSSGGSAAAVAAKMCDIALGSDTGGSIRLPAAYCSVFGFKPSYGRISRFGVISYAQSLDTVGLFARTLPELKDAFAIMDRPDPRDASCISPEMRERISKEYGNKNEVNHDFSKPIRFGILREAIVDMDPEIRNIFAHTLETLTDQGHEIVEVSAPKTKMALPAYFCLSPAEASSNLARYDGIRYGNRASADMDGINEILYGQTRTQGFGSEVQRRLLLGTFNLTSEAYDEHFLKAQKVRRLIVDEFNTLFSKDSILFPPHEEGARGAASAKAAGVDVLINPTSPGKAVSRENHDEENNVADILGDVLTIPANLAGLPAISIPVGKSIGMEIWGQFGDDYMVLETSKIIDDIFKYRPGVDI